MRIYDISIPISQSMPTYPGDPAVRIEPVLQIGKGDTANVSQISFGSHTGTHIDPPAHFIAGGKTIDQLDLQVLYGPVIVVDMTGMERRISGSDLKKLKLPSQIYRILFKTRNSSLWNKPGFQRDYVAFDKSAALWLVERGVRLVGIDYLSAELFDAHGPHAHRVLLGAGVIIVEGVDLGHVAPGAYTLACLPLKLQAGDGAPARAILIAD